MFSSFKHFAHLGEILEIELAGAGLAAYTTEGSNYTAEDGVTNYTAEDGLTIYTDESGGPINYTTENGLSIYTVER